MQDSRRPLYELPINCLSAPKPNKPGIECTSASPHQGVEEEREEVWRTASGWPKDDVKNEREEGEK